VAARSAAEDPFDLDRFVSAQAPVYERVREELSRGRKESHWMWFIFPQVGGLGFSAMAARYGIASLDEAKAYLAHPLLGPRLRECTELMLGNAGRSALGILGPPDDLKFRSSMTLFELAAPGAEVFGQALDTFFAGERDQRTIELLRG
jgi:uncharacterized protein (DUF1810 family)